MAHRLIYTHTLPSRTWVTSALPLCTLQKRTPGRHVSRKRAPKGTPWAERNNLRATPLEEKITEFPQRFIKMDGEHVPFGVILVVFLLLFSFGFSGTHGRMNESVGGVYVWPLRVASSRRRGGIYSRFDSVPATGLNHCIRRRHSVRPPYRHFIGFLVCPFPLRGRVKKKNLLFFSVCSIKWVWRFLAFRRPKTITTDEFCS